MSDKHKNFEDRLRDRLLNEDLSYDDGAWEMFQNTLHDMGDAFVNEKKKRKKAGFWRWFVLIIFLVIAGGLGYNVFKLDSELDGSSELLQIIGDEKESTLKENGSLDVSSPENNSRADFGSSSEVEKNDSDRLNNTDDKTSARNYNESKMSENTIQSEANRSSVDPSADDVESRAKSKHRDRTNELDKNRFGEGVPSGNNRSTLTNEFNLNLSNPIRSENTHLEQTEKMRPDSQLFPITSAQLQGSQPAENQKRPARAVDKSVASLFEPVSREVLNLGKIETLGPKKLSLPTYSDFELNDFIIPLKYKKNEYYFGAGFVNNFSEFSFGSNFSGREDKSVELTYFSLGYARKFAPSWSVAMELNLVHIRNLNMSRSIRDYHQTSTSFEYIEGVMSHGYSNFIGLPVMLKYQPLGSRITFYGGGYMAYAYETRTFFDNEHNGENPVVNELRVFHTGSDHVGKWDAGLLAGATVRIWKGLEIEARANLGLVDLSDDYYWGDGRSTASTYRIGLKYRFLN